MPFSRREPLTLWCGLHDGGHRKVAGLEPRGFKWVIAGRLAISERVGGYGFQHRRVRREEEIIWLAEQGINSVVSLMAGNQNQF